MKAGKDAVVGRAVGRGDRRVALLVLGGDGPVKTERSLASKASNCLHLFQLFGHATRGRNLFRGSLETSYGQRAHRVPPLENLLMLQCLSRIRRNEEGRAILRKRRLLRPCNI